MPNRIRTSFARFDNNISSRICTNDTSINWDLWIRNWMQRLNYFLEEVLLKIYKKRINGSTWETRLPHSDKLIAVYNYTRESVVRQFSNIAMIRRHCSYGRHVLGIPKPGFGTVQELICCKERERERERERKREREKRGGGKATLSPLRTIV